MSIKGKILDKAFSGVRNIWMNVWEKAGTPTESKPVGTLCWDKTNGDAYIATTSSGTWVKINA